MQNINRKNIQKYLLSIFLIVGFIHSSLIADESVIVKFYKKPGSAEKMLIEKNGGTIKHTYTILPAMAIKIPEKNLEALRKHPSVKYIENDQVVISTGRDLEVVKNEKLSDEYKNSWAIDHIKTKKAHDKNITGRDVKIAIIDTGIDYNHLELKANYSGGYNFVKNEKATDDPFDDSWNSHGTHIAGIIAAKMDGIGIVGVAPNASLYAVKVLDSSGFGTISDVVAGIQWAIDNKMDIANISITGISSDILRTACDEGEKAGLLIVAAAGNTYGEPALYPASFDSVISVGGTDDMDNLGAYSAQDPTIELVAPGFNIKSTSKDSEYSVLSGTSQSTAFVSGVAALIISSGVDDINGDGKIDNLDIRKKLQISTVDLGESGRDNIFGFGLIDVERAISTSPSKTNDKIDRVVEEESEYIYTYDQGWNSSWNPGFEEGREDAINNREYFIDEVFSDDCEYSNGWKDGYTKGYENGWNSIKDPTYKPDDDYVYTYDQGWDTGWDPGFEDGRNAACNNKPYCTDLDFDDDGEFDNGWRDGYKNGYDHGWNSCK